LHYATKSGFALQRVAVRVSILGLRRSSPKCWAALLGVLATLARLPGGSLRQSADHRPAAYRPCVLQGPMADAALPVRSHVPLRGAVSLLRSPVRGQAMSAQLVACGRVSTHGSARTHSSCVGWRCTTRWPGDALASQRLLGRSRINPGSCGRSRSVQRPCAAAGVAHAAALVWPREIYTDTGHRR